VAARGSTPAPVKRYFFCSRNLVQLRAQLRERDAAFDALAVAEEKGGRALHAQRASELKHFVHGIGAGRRGHGNLGPFQRGEVEPGPGPVLGAPHRTRVIGGFRTDHGKHEHVDADVIELHQQLLEPAAIRAVRVGEHREHALAVAALDPERKIERQRAEFDRREFLQALRGEIAVGPDVDQLAGEEVSALRVGIHDLRSLVGAKADLEYAGDLRLLYAFDLDAAQLGLDRLADARLVGERRQREKNHRKYKNRNTQHSLHPIAWRISRFFKTGMRSAKFNPALRSLATP